MGKTLHGKDGKFVGYDGGARNIPTPAPPTTAATPPATAPSDDYYAGLARRYEQQTGSPSITVDEPHPTRTRQYLTSHPSGETATVTVTQWTDGRHTVDVEWYDGSSVQREQLVDTDDFPAVDHLVQAWRRRQRRR